MCHTNCRANSGPLIWSLCVQTLGVIRAVADTHVVVWYLAASRRLTLAATAFFEAVLAQGDTVGVSAMSLVEITYLTERRRLPPTVLPTVLSAFDAARVLVEVACNRKAAEAVQRVDRVAVPELPDRVIAATAVHLGVPLITADTRVRTSVIATVW